MQANKRAERPSSAIEQREFERKALNLSGDLIVPAEKATLPCQVLDLSGGGANIRCEDPPPLHTYVILYIAGFGRLEAVTKRFVNGELGLQFLLKETKRQRLLENIYNYTNVAKGEASALRRHARLPSISKVRVTRSGGYELPCEVIDVSMQGLSLRTAARPPIDDLVNIGCKSARVVRHHSEGIAVEFVETKDERHHV